MPSKMLGCEAKQMATKSIEKDFRVLNGVIYPAEVIIDTYAFDFTLPDDERLKKHAGSLIVEAIQPDYTVFVKVTVNVNANFDDFDTLLKFIDDEEKALDNRVKVLNDKLYDKI
jgi:hypothetical protein